MSSECAGFPHILRLSTRCGSCACLLAVPFHLVLQSRGTTDPKAGIRIPCVDLAIWVTCALLLAEGLASGTLLRRARGLVDSAPGSRAFAAAVALSAVAHHGGGIPPADFVQTIDYYVLWPWVMVSVLGDGSAQRLLQKGAAAS